ncbi:MAG TPA: hypothetical protein VN515_02460 [Terriglobales bacterium]|nr:hypothetical protein [Terriglobales bacterium]
MKFRLLGMGLLAAGVFAQAPAVSPRVTYMRSFQGSQPSFFEITVSEDGQATYQARENDGEPLTTLRFTASPETVRQIFRDAKRLKLFAESLQSKDKVAFTGEKSLAYDDAGAHYTQQYTYTKLPAAVELTSLFEKVSTGGMDAIRLRRAEQYTRLDVLDLIVQTQQDWSGGQIAEPQILVPTLEQLAGDANQMQSARNRADKLLKQIQPAGSNDAPR